MRRIFPKKCFRVSVVSLLLLSFTFQFFPLQRPKAAVYNLPDFCNPKIPYYDSSRGKSYEFYQACYLLKDIYNTAYNQVELAKKIGKYTDMFGEYSPLNKCSANCYLSIPGAECTIDLLDLLCLAYPPLCAEKLKDLFNAIQTIQNIIDFLTAASELYSAVVETKEDLETIWTTFFSAWGSFQDALTAIGDIDLSQLKSFSQDLIDLTNAQATTTKKVTEIETRFNAMKKHVESFLGLLKFGFSRDQISDIFDTTLTTSLQEVSGEDFYQRFLDIRTWVYQIEHFLPTSTPELLEKIKALEERTDQNVSEIEEIRMFPEETRMQTLQYLSYSKNPLFIISENLNLIEEGLDELSILSEAEIELRIASTTQTITLVKPSIETIITKIQQIEGIISPKTLQGLAQEIGPLVEKIKGNVAAQVFGYGPNVEPFSNISAPTSSIWEIFREIDSSDFQKKFNEMYTLASSTKELSCHVCKRGNGCGSCDEAKNLESAITKVMNSLVEIKSFLSNRFKKEQPQRMTQWLRYLNQLNPKVLDLLTKLNSTRDKVVNFVIASDCTGCQDALQSNLVSIKLKIDQVKLPFEEVKKRVENIEKIAGMNILELAKLYGVIEKIERLIQRGEEIKETVITTGPNLETTKEELQQQYDQIRTQLEELKTLKDQKSCSFPDVLKGAAQEACNNWCWPSKGTIPTNYSTHPLYTRWKGYGKASFSNCRYWDSFYRYFTNPIKPDGKVQCVCQDSELLQTLLPSFGIRDAYLAQISTKIDEAILSIDPLEEAAIKAMGVMSALIAIMKIDDVIDGIYDITGKCVKCQEDEKCEGGEKCGLGGKCKTGEKCQGGLIRELEEDISRVKTAWKDLWDGPDKKGDVGRSGCKLKGDFLDYCKELPSRGVYGERSCQLFIDLSALQKQISDDFGRISSLTHRIGELKKENPGAGIEIVESKAEQIWEKSMWLNVFVTALNSHAKKSTCGKSWCTNIWCLPAVADLVGWDCDWEICKALGGKTEGNKCNIEGIRFWQGKNNGICEIPTLDAFNYTDNWMAWLLSWLITMDNGFIDALEEKIKE